MTNKITNEEQGPITKRILESGLTIREVDYYSKYFGYNHFTKQIYKASFHTDEIHSPYIAVRLANQLAKHYYRSKHPILASLSDTGWEDTTKLAKSEGKGIVFFLLNIIPQISVWKITKKICEDANVDSCFYESERDDAFGTMFEYALESFVKTIWLMSKGLIYLFVLLMSVQTLFSLDVIDVNNDSIQALIETLNNKPIVYIELFPPLYTLLVLLWVTKKFIIDEFASR